MNDYHFMTKAKSNRFKKIVWKHTGAYLYRFSIFLFFFYYYYFHLLANIHSFCKCPNKNSALGNNYDHTRFTRTYETRGGNKNTNAVCKKKTLNIRLKKCFFVCFFTKMVELCTLLSKNRCPGHVQTFFFCHCHFCFYKKSVIPFNFSLFLHI